MDSSYTLALAASQWLGTASAALWREVQRGMWLSRLQGQRYRDTPFLRSDLAGLDNDSHAMDEWRRAMTDGCQ
jgi:hypothetical protein